MTANTSSTPLALLLLLLAIFGLSCQDVAAFGLPRTSTRAIVQQQRLFSTVSTADVDEDPTTMRLGEIQAELKGMKVSYADCFDKESLVKRLKDARAGLVQPSESKEGSDSRDDNVSGTSTETSKAKAKSSSTSATTSSASSFDREAVLSDLRILRVKELRTRLSERSIRWAGLLEKEDLVRALADAMERAANFSPSGALEPGKATDITDEQLDAEITRAAETGTPLLLDVYATWCGPCQMMAPQLSAAAAELGEKVRVAKIDSDKYPEWASRLRVGGLPTVLVFDAEGKEVNRVEGALMKDGLLDLVVNAYD
mmetsp:Transcript_5408/g.11783  ORF Transcript_5408/g.11783 Transcript_5408/m.11783 type:complete len:313 (+) Transcript_5408:69-1007(+)|eukprot:CAMPEP_0178550464 /NCGR_PEP_ID=MMETSP0697-20121206/6270_1 /TAXON_ID=265572 /ORGANISM="Extubocellulus spinifer, Strain CCMP396" /LENGTH=312 /DNA_ID=CAMNT_0020183261 /DNA_START=10 /DNA_END=948 /DNA_ORIENTATION=-